MEISHRENDFLRGFDKLTTRRGVSGMAVVFVISGLLIISAGFLSWKFKQSDLSVSQGFFGKTSALVSKTFGGMFSSGQDKPVAEIDLGERMTGGNGGEIKNTSSSPSFAKASKGSSHFESSQQTAKYLTEEKKKISENKNSVSPAENPIVQPSANGNNFSATSSSDSKLPTVNNLKTSASSSPTLCDFKKVQTPNHKILFSEVAWMGSVKSASDEWIELKNNSGRDVPFAGWQILSGDENIKIIFDGKNNFPAGGLYLLERSDDNSAPDVPADKIYSGALSNSGVILGIFNPNCELADEINASKTWSAGDNATKKTMERSFLDLSWHTSGVVGGTPKAQNSAAFLTGQSSVPPQSGNASPAPSSSSQNVATSSDTSRAASTSTSATPTSTSPTPAPASSSHILISDIQTTGGPGQTTNDFVKIFNPLSSSFNLKGHRLVKRTKTSTSDTSLKSWTADTFISPGGYYLWANSAFTTLTPPPDVTTTGSIADDNGLAIRSGPEDTGTIIDSVAWGAAQNTFIEGSVYPANPTANQILARKIVNGAMQDVNNNAEDFEIR